jgi:hemolysin III
MSATETPQSPREELANALSHGLGALLSATALGWMVALAIPRGPWETVGVAVFGVSLILLYLSSTWYHATTAPAVKKRLQVLDHAMIFVLIAGSYTPWLLVNLRGPWGWSLFGTVWLIAFVGVILKVIFLPRFDRLGTALYVVMGWIICIAGKELLAKVNPVGLAWLLAGGLCYTGGVVFYLQRRLPFAHLIWHMFVMAGSACHVVAVIVGVLSGAA